MQKQPDQNAMAHSCRTNALFIVLTLMFSEAHGADVKASADEEGPDQVVAKLLAIRPGLPVESIYPAAVEGLYGVDFPDGTTIYITADGEHMIVGDMYAIGDDLSNVTEQRRVAQRVTLMGQVDLADMVIFPAKGERRAVVNIFTDVDCGYCRKLHNEIEQYAELGIEVRYLAYPREGLESDTASTMRSVWCSSDPTTAMTRAKNSQRIVQRDCPTDPVDEQFALGQRLGVSGTPSIITDSGEMFPGYISAAQLAQRLGLSL